MIERHLWYYARCENNTRGDHIQIYEDGDLVFRLRGRSVNSFGGHFLERDRIVLKIEIYGVFRYSEVSSKFQKFSSTKNIFFLGQHFLRNFFFEKVFEILDFF